ncbi:cilia- and flagella-associated protein 251-like [Hetaerina americana]|uniref:cilia- and flagella-associated protein 251-like n=1 Tax=Hetaerina americana TaxID=62018 RepID=UPI003A7F6120
MTSETITKTDSSAEDSSEEMSSLIENNVTSALPLSVNRAIGRSNETRIVNLTTNFRKAIAYSCSHLVVILYYETQEHKFLYGHKNLITSLSSDGNEDFLVSSDTGTYLFDVSLSTVNNVVFNVNNAKNFMLTTRRTVLFFKWNYGSSNPVDPEVSIPPPLPGRYCGHLSESLYLKGYSQSITATTDGYILVWNDNTTASWIGDHSTSTCKKILEKWLLLQKDGITCLNQLDKFVVTGDSSGTIRFYDHMLRLIHWIQYPGMPKNLKQIEFHLQLIPQNQMEKNKASLNGN